MTIRSQTNELNSQLSMFQHRNDEIEMVGRRSEMNAANTVHELYLEASRQDEQSLKEQQTLAVLTKKRELVASKINSLVK